MVWSQPLRPCSRFSQYGTLLPSHDYGERVISLRWARTSAVQWMSTELSVHNWRVVLLDDRKGVFVYFLGLVDLVSYPLCTSRACSHTLPPGV